MAPRKRPPPLPPGTRTYYNLSFYYDPPSGQWLGDMPGDSKQPGVLIRADNLFDAFTKLGAFGIVP
jgi:hypothetical protein